MGIFGCLSEDFLKVLLSRQTGGSLEGVAAVAKAIPIFQDLFYKHKDIKISVYSDYWPSGHLDI